MTTLTTVCFPSILPGINDRRVSNDLFSEEVVVEPKDTSFCQLSKIRVLDKLINEIVEVYFDCREDDWDGYGAKKVESSTVEYSCRFLVYLLAKDFPKPEIFADTDGEIGFEWYYNPRRIFSARVGRDGTISYGGLMGPAVFHGVEILSDESPELVMSGIERVTKIAS